MDYMETEPTSSSTRAEVLEESTIATLPSSRGRSPWTTVTKNAHRLIRQLTTAVPTAVCPENRRSRRKANGRAATSSEIVST